MADREKERKTKEKVVGAGGEGRGWCGGWFRADEKKKSEGGLSFDWRRREGSRGCWLRAVAGEGGETGGSQSEAEGNRKYGENKEWGLQLHHGAWRLQPLLERKRCSPFFLGFLGGKSGLPRRERGESDLGFIFFRVLNVWFFFVPYFVGEQLYL